MMIDSGSNSFYLKNIHKCLIEMCNLCTTWHENYKTNTIALLFGNNVNIQDVYIPLLCVSAFEIHSLIRNISDFCYYFLIFTSSFNFVRNSETEMTRPANKCVTDKRHTKQDYLKFLLID